MQKQKYLTQSKSKSKFIDMRSTASQSTHGVMMRQVHVGASSSPNTAGTTSTKSLGEYGVVRRLARRAAAAIATTQQQHRQAAANAADAAPMAAPDDGVTRRGDGLGKDGDGGDAAAAAAL